MSIDAGTIQTSAELDISQFLKGTQQLQSAVQQMNRSLEQLQPATPKLNTQQFSRDTDHARVILRGFISEFGMIPGVSTGVSGSLAGVGAAAGVMGVAAGAAATAMVAGLTASAKAASDLQEQVAAVKSIKLDLDTASATTSLRQLAAETGQSAGSLAKGLYNLFSSITVPQEQAVILMRQFAQGAVAAQTDASTFGTAVIGVLNAYKLQVSDAAHVSDIFFNTVNAGVVSGQQLAAGLGPITASAKQAGVSLEELGALIVGVTKEGGDAAQNLNNLNNLLLKLVTKETTQSFKDLGITVADASGKLRTPIAILGDLKVRLDAMTEAQKANALQDIFPDIQARQGAQVILSQLETVRAALVTNQTEVGSTQAAYQTMAETNAAAVRRFQESITGLAGTLGDTLLPAMTGAVTGLANVVDGFGAVGRAIDAFLADDKTRQAAAQLIQLRAAAGGVGDIGGRAAAAGTALGTSLPIPQAPTEPTAAGNFLQTALDQFGEKGQGGVQAAVKGLQALGRAMSGATEESEALGAAFKAAFANAEALAERTRQLDQDDQEYTRGAKALREQQEAVRNAIELTAIAQQRLAAGLTGGIGAQADWTAEIVRALDPTKNLSGVSGTQLVEGILKAKQATEDSTKAFEIRDLAIAVEVIRLRDLASKTTDVGEALALQRQAGDLAAAALDAQAKGSAAATANAEALAKPLKDLASTILPALTAQQQAHVREIEATDGPYQALAEAARQAGIDIGKFGDLTQLTGAQLAEVNKEVAAAVKGFASFLTDEQNARFSSVLSGLVSGTDAVTAAQAKQAEAAGHADDALRLLLEHVGVGPGAIANLTRSLEEGGAAAFDAREKIAALTAFVRDQAGQVRLKVDVDIETAKQKIAELRETIGTQQRAFQEANAKRAEDESRATREFQEQQAALSQQQSQASADYRTNLQALSQARTDSTAQLGRDIASVNSAQNKAAREVADTARTAELTFNVALDDAAASYDLAILESSKSAAEGYKAFTEQATAAMDAATQRQADALRQAGQAMSAAALQALATINQQSVTREDLTNRTLIGAHTAEETSALATERIRLEATQGFQNAQSALSQQQARDKLAQDQFQADVELNKTINSLIKELQKLQAQQVVAQTKAAVTEAIQSGLAARARETVQIGDQRLTDFELAMRDVGVDLKAAGLGPKLGGLAAQEAAQRRATEQGMGKAFEEDHQRRKAVEDKAADEQRKRDEQLIALNEERVRDPLGLGRTRAEQDAAEAARQRREEQRQADKQFQEQQKQGRDSLKKQEDQLRALEALKDLPETIGAAVKDAMQGQERANTFNFQRVVNQETGTDFLAVAARELLTRGQGGL